MSIIMIIILAIVVASCAFGLNQIIVMSDDVKFIKSVIKDQFGSPTQPTPTSVPATVSAPVANEPSLQPVLM